MDVVVAAGGAGVSYVVVLDQRVDQHGGHVVQVVQRPTVWILEIGRAMGTLLPRDQVQPLNMATVSTQECYGDDRVVVVCTGSTGSLENDRVVVPSGVKQGIRQDPSVGIGSFGVLNGKWGQHSGIFICIRSVVVVAALVQPLRCGKQVRSSGARTNPRGGFVL